MKKGIFEINPDKDAGDSKVVKYSFEIPKYITPVIFDVTDLPNPKIVSSEKVGSSLLFSADSESSSKLLICIPSDLPTVELNRIKKNTITDKTNQADLIIVLSFFI